MCVDITVVLILFCLGILAVVLSGFFSQPALSTPAVSQTDQAVQKDIDLTLRQLEELTGEKYDKARLCREYSRDRGHPGNVTYFQEMGNCFRKKKSSFLEEVTAVPCNMEIKKEILFEILNSRWRLNSVCSSAE